MTTDHLSNSTRLFMDNLGSDPNHIKRIHFIQEDKWINYSRALQILKRVERMSKAPKVLRPQSLLIRGDSQNGKSSLKEHISQLYKEYQCREGEQRKRIVSIEVPSDVSVKSFINTLLVAVNATEFVTNKADSVMRSLLRHLESERIGFIMMDEIHHVGRAQPRQLRILLDTIKSVTSQAKIPIVAFGIMSASVILSKDPQLNSRFTKMDLPVWDKDVEFKRLLASFESLLPLQKPSKLIEDKLAYQILTRTNGTIGEISRLLQELAIVAIETGKEMITIDMVHDIPFDSCKDDN